MKGLEPMWKQWDFLLIETCRMTLGLTLPKNRLSNAYKRFLDDDEGAAECS
jgi:hypothetical protein